MAGSPPTTPRPMGFMSFCDEDQLKELTPELPRRKGQGEDAARVSSTTYPKAAEDDGDELSKTKPRKRTTTGGRWRKLRKAKSSPQPPTGHRVGTQVNLVEPDEMLAKVLSTLKDKSKYAKGPEKVVSMQEAERAVKDMHEVMMILKSVTEDAVARMENEIESLKKTISMKDEQCAKLAEEAAEVALTNAMLVRRSSLFDGEESTDRRKKGRRMTKTKRKKEKSLRINPWDVSILRLIGMGGSGSSVYECKMDGFTCVLKKVRVDETSRMVFEGALHEVEVYELVPKHPNLMQSLAYNVDDGTVSLFCPKYDMNLSQFLESVTEPLPHELLRRIARRIASGIKALHNAGIIHRDVKPENVLLTIGDDDLPLEVVLGDFDSAIIIENGLPSDCVGTPGFMAPEVLSAPSSGQEYTEACDVFSFGMVLFQLMTRRVPYDDIEKVFNISKAVLSGSSPLMTPHIQLMYPKIADLHSICIALEPESRPTASECAFVLDRIEKGPQDVSAILASLRMIPTPEPPLE